tara:strand:+ start:308 stop:529 length:222 start_codon:yes stop_codon:yes gene_type:complete
MSREELTNFVIAAERSQMIKRDLLGHENFEEIISIANKYGFNITEKDFKEDCISASIGKWFKEAKIFPIKKTL